MLDTVLSTYHTNFSCLLLQTTPKVRDLSACNHREMGYVLCSSAL